MASYEDSQRELETWSNEKKRQEDQYMAELQLAGQQLNQIQQNRLDWQKSTDNNQVDEAAAKKAAYDESWQAYYDSQKLSSTEVDKIKEKNPEQRELDELHRQLRDLKEKIKNKWGSEEWQPGLDIQVNKLLGENNKNISDQMMATVPEHLKASLKPQSDQLDQEYRERVQNFKQNGPTGKDLEKFDKESPQIAPETKKQFNNMVEELMHVQRRVAQHFLVKRENDKLPKDQQVVLDDKPIKQAVNNANSQTKDFSNTLTEVRAMKQQEAVLEQKIALKQPKQVTQFVPSKPGYDSDPGTFYDVSMNSKNADFIMKDTATKFNSNPKNKSEGLKAEVSNDGITITDKQKNQTQMNFDKNTGVALTKENDPKKLSYFERFLNTLHGAAAAIKKVLGMGPAVPEAPPMSPKTAPTPANEAQRRPSLR